MLASVDSLDKYTVTISKKDKNRNMASLWQSEQEFQRVTTLNIYP